MSKVNHDFELALNEILAVRPFFATFLQYPVNLVQLHRWKRTRKRRCGSGCKHKTWNAIIGKIAVWVAIGMINVIETENMAVFALGHNRRVIQRDALLITVKISHTHKEIKLMAKWKQGCCGRPGLAHGLSRIHQHVGHQTAGERRFKPAGAHEG